MISGVELKCYLPNRTERRRIMSSGIQVDSMPNRSLYVT